jgi:hypothetical protein
MERDTDIHKEMKDMAPDFPWKPTFETPSGYFDRLPDQVLVRWKEDDKKGGGKIMVWRKMVAAAAIVTGFSLGIMWWTNQSMLKTNSTDITSADAYVYILENLDEFSPLLLQQDQWAEDSKIELPDSSAVEEYLLEEMDGEELEKIF